MAAQSLLSANRLAGNVCTRSQVGAQRLSARSPAPQRLSGAQPRRRSAAVPLAVADIASSRRDSAQDVLTTGITLIHSPTELQAVNNANKGKLVIMECKANGCRPCKKFQKNYIAAAKYYSDSVFLEILGDESKENRQLMRELGIKSTPTFVIFRDGVKLHQHGGANQEKLHVAIQEQLQANEAGKGSYTLLPEEPKVGGAAH